MVGKSVILAESFSPVCDVQAFVEETDTTCYFYLWFYPGEERAYMKSCWICNTAPAPAQFDLKSMNQGLAPALEAKYVKHDMNGIHLRKNALSVVWFEEGDAAALLEDDELLCVIPGWSDGRNFCGYSRYAAGTTPFAWELEPAEPVLSARVDRCKAFWDYFEQNYWINVQQMHIRTLENFFGRYQGYFAIDGEEFPPRALITGKKDGTCYAITAGVSLIPMPLTEQYYKKEDAHNYRRIELGFAATEDRQDVCVEMYSYLSGLCVLPWREITFLGHGHTVPCNVIDGFCAVWLLNARLLPALGGPEYEDFMSDNINLLWAIPVTGQEYELLQAISCEEALGRVVCPLEQLAVFDGKARLAIKK